MRVVEVVENAEENLQDVEGQAGGEGGGLKERIYTLKEKKNKKTKTKKRRRKEPGLCDVSDPV